MEYKFGADAGEAGDAPYERPQRAAAHRQLHGRVASVSSAFGVWEEEEEEEEGKKEEMGCLTIHLLLGWAFVIHLSYSPRSPVPLALFRCQRVHNQTLGFTNPPLSSRAINCLPPEPSAAAAPDSLRPPAASLQRPRCVTSPPPSLYLIWGLSSA